MAAKTSSFEELTGGAMRDFAQSRSVGVVKYGNLLIRFGKGEVTPTAFGEETLKLVLEESARYAQDAIKLGGAWLSFMSELTRAADSRPEASTTRTKPSRAARSRKKSSHATA